MKFYELNNKNRNLNKGFIKIIKKIIKKGDFILGDEVFKLEKKLASFVKSKHCISTSSGTDSLLLSLLALGVKRGDEIITSPFTFVSTVEVIKLLGAKPVFVDINPKTFNIDDRLIQKKITKRTKGIIAVSLFGQTANFSSINKIAKKNHLFTIEDAAQSFGAKHQKIFSCNLSTVACTSFFPTKPLGGFGDGGACFTNNLSIAKKIVSLRNHGQIQKYKYDSVGVNGRLDTIQAGIILVKLKIFKKEIYLRNKVAKVYNELIDKYKKSITAPFVENFNQSVYSQYAILLKNRKKTIQKFKKNKIPCAIYYPKPIYFFKPYRKYKSSCPASEKICKQILNLPMHPYLSFKDQKKIIKNIIE